MGVGGRRLAVVCHHSRWGDGPREKERGGGGSEPRKGQLDHGRSKALSKHV